MPRSTPVPASFPPTLSDVVSAPAEPIPANAKGPENAVQPAGGEAPLIRHDMVAVSLPDWTRYEPGNKQRHGWPGQAPAMTRAGRADDTMDEVGWRRPGMT